MSRLSRLVLPALLVITLSAGRAEAACSVASPVYTATNAADLASCFTQATHSGDQVHISGAGFTVTAQLTWTAPANALLYGDGSGTTTITDNIAGSSTGMIDITTNASGTFRVTALKFNGGAAAAAKDGGLFGIEGNSQSFRFDHNIVDTSTYASGNGKAIGTAQCVAGVIDHNTLTAAVSSSTNLINVHEGSCFSDAVGVGDQMWSHSTGLGTATNWIYVEDNTFNNGAGNDCEAGGKNVFRFNTFNATAPPPILQTHPTGSGGRIRGCRAWEIYLNQFIAANSNYVSNGLWQSAGTGVIWGNSIPSSSVGGGTGVKNFISLYNMRYTGTTYAPPAPPTDWGLCSTHHNGTGSNWDGDPTTGYPCIDQIGRGIGDLIVNDFPNATNNATGCASASTCAYPRQTLEPVYEWLDVYSPVPSNPSQFADIDPLITANQDYYFGVTNGACPGSCGANISFDGTVGVGFGARASRPATCTAGVAYWSTDQGSWNDGHNSFYTGQGVLDKCLSTNTWTNAVYTPYTYPHPLTQTETSSPSKLIPMRMILMIVLLILGAARMVKATETEIESITKSRESQFDMATRVHGNAVDDLLSVRDATNSADRTEDSEQG